MVAQPSSTRSTKNQSNNSLPSSSSPTSLPVRATARKSIASQGPRQNSQSSATASMSSTSRTTRQVTTGGGPSNKGGGNSSNQSQTQKRTQRIDSGSDNESSPPARDTPRNRQSVALPSTSRSESTSPPPSSSKKSRLSVSQSFTKGSPSKQGGPQKNLISKCVSYILVADRKKYPIRKADIVKNVFEDANSKDYSYVLIEANKVLKKTFGLELLTLQNQKNSYILINILDPDHGIHEFAEYSEEELQKRGLIFLLLTIIFMNENYIAEDKLWKALEALGVYPNSSTPHPVFGNIKKFITTELVREMYLEYTRVNKDPVQYEFRWGERAYQEVKKKDLLEFACNIMGDCKPQDWKLQFRDANPNEV